MSLPLKCPPKFWGLAPSLLGTSLEQAVNNLTQTWWHYQTCHKVVLTSLIQSWQQGCNNTAISWLCRTCWNNLVTSLIISTRLLQIVNSLFQTCWQLGQAVRAQLIDGLLADLLQRWDFYSCRRTCFKSKHVKTHKLLQVCKQVVTNLFTSCSQVVLHSLFLVVVTSLEQAVNNL
jgi:hypothetical protein